MCWRCICKYMRRMDGQEWNCKWYVLSVACEWHVKSRYWNRAQGQGHYILLTNVNTIYYASSQLFCNLFVRGLHRSPVYFPVQRTNNANLWCFVVRLKKLFNKHWNCRWFETWWRSSNVAVIAFGPGDASLQCLNHPIFGAKPFLETTNADLLSIETLRKSSCEILIIKNPVNSHHTKTCIYMIW